MPLYVYKCADGHSFEQVVKLDGSNAPARCPIFTDRDDPTRRCEAGVTKILAPVASIFPGADSWQK